MNSFNESTLREIKFLKNKKGKLTREERIILEINNNPGIRFRELMKSMKVTNGIISYYIQKLEKVGIIFSERKSGVSRLFASTIELSDVSTIKFLRTPTPQKIMLLLLKEDLLTFKQITEKIQMSPSTTSFYLKKLITSGTVTISGVGKKKYSLKDNECVSNLIQLYHPSIVDSASENLADIFS
tara:strand:- start:108 stop:659 length:552 start_codon:yes stop_codon:yes gene_type:complete